MIEWNQDTMPSEVIKQLYVQKGISGNTRDALAFTLGKLLVIESQFKKLKWSRCYAGRKKMIEYFGLFMITVIILDRLDKE